MDRKPHWGAESARRRAAKACDETAEFWDERGDAVRASRERLRAQQEREGAERERLRGQ
jgi:histidinol-phosphate/aromatic aminotransferase/cobyric acid decarboxylase-like protein